MKSFSAPLVALAVLVAGVSAQTFTINTPLVLPFLLLPSPNLTPSLSNPPVQCVATQFTWMGGTGESWPFCLSYHVLTLNSHRALLPRKFIWCVALFVRPLT